MTRNPAKARAKSKFIVPASVTKPQNDTALINECVVYAQSVAAFNAGFKADPDGSSIHAESLGDAYSNRAKKALAKITHMPARTPEGLESKARVMLMVLDDCAGGMEEDEEVFYRSFAVNVRKFFERRPAGAYAEDGKS